MTKEEMKKFANERGCEYHYSGKEKKGYIWPSGSGPFFRCRPIMNIHSLINKKGV